MSSWPRLMVAGGELHSVLLPAAAAGALVQLRCARPEAGALAEQAVAALEAGIAPDRLLIHGSTAGACEIARRLGCGLHLPARAPAPGRRSDLPRPWGRAVHGIAEAEAAAGRQPDYLVAGTIFATPSKPGREPAGTGFLARLAARVAPLPVFAIGGVDAGRLEAVIAAGAHGAAVVRAVRDAPDPGRAAANLIAALERAAAGHRV